MTDQSLTTEARTVYVRQLPEDVCLCMCIYVYIYIYVCDDRPEPDNRGQDGVRTSGP